MSDMSSNHFFESVHHLKKSSSRKKNAYILTTHDQYNLFFEFGCFQILLGALLTMTLYWKLDFRTLKNKCQNLCPLQLHSSWSVQHTVNTAVFIHSIMLLDGLFPVWHSVSDEISTIFLHRHMIHLLVFNRYADKTHTFVLLLVNVWG